MLLGQLRSPQSNRAHRRPTLHSRHPGSSPATPSPSPKPSATASPIHVTPPAAGLLFAVTEGGYPPPNVSEPGTIAIVRTQWLRQGEGEVSAAHGAGNPRLAYTPQQGLAQVVGSGVYYIDRAGTVRVLRVGSQPQVVARFPLQPAQEDVWFAVSPDGSAAPGRYSHVPRPGTDTFR